MGGQSRPRALIGGAAPVAYQRQLAILVGTTRFRIVRLQAELVEHGWVRPIRHKQLPHVTHELPSRAGDCPRRQSPALYADGGSPSLGFLSGSTGPFTDFYMAIAGAGLVNWPVRPDRSVRSPASLAGSDPDCRRVPAGCRATPGAPLTGSVHLNLRHTRGGCLISPEKVPTPMTEAPQNTGPSSNRRKTTDMAGNPESARCCQIASDQIRSEPRCHGCGRCGGSRGPAAWPNAISYFSPDSA